MNNKKDFECNICKNFVLKPVYGSKCNDYYCKNCFQNYKKFNKEFCYCGEICNANLMSNFMMKILSKKIVNCSNCEFKGIYDLYKDHKCLFLSNEKQKIENENEKILLNNIMNYKETWDNKFLNILKKLNQINYLDDEIQEILIQKCNICYSHLCQIDKKFCNFCNIEFCNNCLFNKKIIICINCKEYSCLSCNNKNNCYKCYVINNFGIF